MAVARLCLHERVARQLGRQLQYSGVGSLWWQRLFGKYRTSQGIGACIGRAGHTTSHHHVPQFGPYVGRRPRMPRLAAGGHRGMDDALFRIVSKWIIHPSSRCRPRCRASGCGGMWALLFPDASGGDSRRAVGKHSAPVPRWQ